MSVKVRNRDVSSFPVIDNTKDSPRDIAYSSWLADCEDFLKKTFGRSTDEYTKQRIGEYIGHDPKLGWQADPADCYHMGGAKFDKDGQFLSLGGYWKRVRAIGHLLAKGGYHRALGTIRHDAPSTAPTAPDPAAWDRLVAMVRECTG